MTFTSQAITLDWNRNNLVLTRGTSQLLIKAEDIQALRMLKEESEFNDHFRTKALMNREARRVFEAWERKDTNLLAKLYKEVLA